MHYIVSFSGGAGSWAAGRRVVDEHGPDAVTLLVANTNSEAPDWLPFVEACATDLEARLVVLDNGGRSIWDVFREARFLGNTRVDVCSRVLKREPIRAWLEENTDPAETTLVLGFDWTEEHRHHRAAPRWAPWPVLSPLCHEPYVQKAEVLGMLRERGIPEPPMYAEGFPHNNCGGACVKAGQAQWRLLLEKHPERYAEAEQQEEALRVELGDVAILRDRRGGTTKPLTLRRFRQQAEFDRSDWGACSCMESGSEG